MTGTNPRILSRGDSRKLGIHPRLVQLILFLSSSYPFIILIILLIIPFIILTCSCIRLFTFSLLFFHTSFVLSKFHNFSISVSLTSFLCVFNHPFVLQCIFSSIYVSIHHSKIIFGFIAKEVAIFIFCYFGNYKHIFLVICKLAKNYYCNLYRDKKTEIILL